MTKSLKTKMVAIIIAGILVVLGIVGLVILLPRKFVSVAGIGKLEHVNAIVYKSSPCCGYPEGAEFEAALTDSEAIADVVEQFNNAKMQWTIPVMLAGGSNNEVIFRTESGNKTVQFKNGKIGNFKFNSQQTALNELAKKIYRPYIYVMAKQEIKLSANFIMLDTYEDYQHFIETNDWNNNNMLEDIDADYFKTKRVLLVDVGEGSSLREFYLTKITQTAPGAHLLKLENKSRGNLNDDYEPMTAVLSVDKMLDDTKLTFEVVQ